jgi:hypothetical protein
MYDAGKIITGIVIFLILMTVPIWYVVATGQASYVPDPKVNPDETQCVESTDYMIKNHMILLDEWKTSCVRDGICTWVSSEGETYNASLAGTCLSSCHPSKAEFCDQCHNYVGISPYCWNCHISGE